ncbi:tRNA N6-adenosine threonylcarbamoyltransferase [Candidatus Xenohaliotis californiensis]|uniref:tRNA N6-adenosine threonylcarbamoyltransferase n=1 Tax=Candidatus Xenohaliotis californiensis TaxID=84677 RepID=A0ABP0EXJ1_9RICK|nr:tRNA N6-adenosine threonylcarbamoyltransferase [Candidatus Xenohaliotis californiensis]
MLVLGIETSCDETAAAIVDNKKNIVANVVFSQILEHAKYNGVVPEIAARMHIKNIEMIVNQAMTNAKIDYKQLDAVAATSGPGLIGCLMVGLMTAKGIALATNKPFIAINHLEGHILTPILTNNIEFPYFMLLMSGGHCQILVVKSLGNYIKIGETLDDSVGEAFDKVAKMLKLNYPGGPIIENRALLGKSDSIKLPRPLIKQNNHNFSFSGLKTAVKRIVDKTDITIEQNVNNICASFQEAVKDIFVVKLDKLLPMLKINYPAAKYLVVSGGVASNKQLRKSISNVALQHNLKFAAPPVAMCTDNAAMIAWAGVERAKIGQFSNINHAPQARWPIDSPDIQITN